MKGPTDALIVQRIEESHELRHLCTCLIGKVVAWHVHHKAKKCCVPCPGCGSRIRRGYVNEHLGKCVAWKRKSASMSASRLPSHSEESADG